MFTIVINVTPTSANTASHICAFPSTPNPKTISLLTSNYNLNATFLTFNNRNDIVSNLKEDKVSYILVPLTEYIDIGDGLSISKWQ